MAMHGNYIYHFCILCTCLIAFRLGSGHLSQSVAKFPPSCSCEPEVGANIYIYSVKLGALFTYDYIISCSSACAL